MLKPCTKVVETCHINVLGIKIQNKNNLEQNFKNNDKN